MKRNEKESFVSHVKKELDNSSIVVAVDRSSGITVAEITKLRKDMHDAEANFKILKNTLARIIVKDSMLDGLSKYLKGPTALAYSNNPVGMSKALSQFSEANEKLSILGGIMDGKA
ncbi:MAG: 50S ribosomal protein L10, partial [Streptococcaceae bacterium]|nr:50S ribosomal protein L10 [Streptococcaceae bacterium]